MGQYASALDGVKAQATNIGWGCYLLQLAKGKPLDCHLLRRMSLFVADFVAEVV